LQVGVQQHEEPGGAVEKIVVGVDGSLPSQAALEFAADEATFRQARLLVVCVWELPQSAVVIAGASQEMVEAFRKDAETILADALARARELHPSISSESRAIEGHPSHVLLEEAREATLVVVGSRGRGGFSSMFLGSVSDAVVHHSGCSVVVVRPRHDFRGWKTA
jgi:nucleotide-binding universal stress UspA family protein